MVIPRPDRFIPGKDPVPIVREARWAPGPVWTGAKNVTYTGIQSQDRPVRSESLTTTELSKAVQNDEEWSSNISSGVPNSQLTSERTPNSLINTAGCWRQNYAHFITQDLKEFVGSKWTELVTTRGRECHSVSVSVSVCVVWINDWARQICDITFLVVLWRLENKMK